MKSVPIKIKGVQMHSEVEMSDELAAKIDTITAAGFVFETTDKTISLSRVDYPYGHFETRLTEADPLGPFIIWLADSVPAASLED